MLNIIICGTPGTGKSTIIERLKSLLPQEKFRIVNVGKFAIENKCIEEERDDKLESEIIDEDKLLALLLPTLRENKLNIIETIHADVIPSDIVDWVFVCRTDNTKLYDRLKARNYNPEKMDNNLQAEIFQTILDEASECFGSSIISELTNNDDNDLERNVSEIETRIRSLLKSVEEK